MRHLRDGRRVRRPVGGGVDEGVVSSGEEAETIGGVARIGGESDGIAGRDDGAHAELIVDELAADDVGTIGEGGGSQRTTGSEIR